MNFAKPYSIPVTWSPLYQSLSGTPWEQEDLDVYRYWRNNLSHCAPAVDALKTVYDMARDWQGPIDPENAVLAVLKAAHQHRGGIYLSPEDVIGMARRFSVFYTDMDTVLTDYLAEHHNGIPLEWLNSTGREAIESSIKQESEIWIAGERHLPGVWVFDKP